MEIYIVRHGDAIEGEIDELRELSEKGKKQAKKAGKKLKKLRFEEIFSSPLKRAVQTAEIIGKEIKFKGKINTTELLMPNSNPSEILNHIFVMNIAKILIVGHQPFIGNFIKLISNQDVEVKKGSVWKIEIEDKKFKSIEQIV